MLGGLGMAAAAGTGAKDELGSASKESAPDPKSMSSKRYGLSILPPKNGNNISDCRTSCDRQAAGLNNEGFTILEISASTVLSNLEKSTDILLRIVRQYMGEWMRGRSGRQSTTFKTLAGVTPRSFSAETIRWQSGDTGKPNPFFILVLNNIALERPLGSKNFFPDLVASGNSTADKGPFTTQAQYIYRNLFGNLPGQADKVLGLSPHAAKVKFHSVYVWGLQANGATALIGEDGTPGSTIISPRRSAVTAMLAYLGLDPDIVFIVSKSDTHDRASAYGTTDNDTLGGVPGTYDGRAIVQRYYHTIPGMAAMHITADAMTAAHEFGHAFSSYSNGFITDLYVDGAAEFNRKNGRPIPGPFCSYNNHTFQSDITRDGLGYPANWVSYHSELADASRPALMDNYWLATGGPLTVQHDMLTRAYYLDRVAAKVGR